MSGAPIIILAGLTLESRIAMCDNPLVFCHDRTVPSVRMMEHVSKSGCRGILSFGLAGGLTPELGPGDPIVASRVIDSDRLFPTDPQWSSELLMALPHATYAPIAGVEDVVFDIEARHALRAQTGANCVDTESHLAARIAEFASLKLAVVRIIIDPVHQRIPAAAVQCVGAGGKPQPVALARKLMRSPQQIPDILRLAVEWSIARRTLILASARLQRTTTIWTMEGPEGG